MRKGTARIAGLILVALTTMPVAAETRVALVIANDAYRNAAHLRTAASDASLIAAALKQDGFAVSIANNLDYDSFFQDAETLCQGDRRRRLGGRLLRWA